MTDIEVFASNGQNIYRRVVGATSGSWGKLANLDATKLDITSDLDCSSNSNTVHIVAQGSNPLGAFMHATGFGAAFNPFVRELASNTPATFGYKGVSVAAWANEAEAQIQLAATTATGASTWATYDGSSYGAYAPPTFESAFASAPDAAYQLASGDNPRHAELVAFTGMGMAYFDLAYGYGSNWYTNYYANPPAGTTYSYSPTLCTYSNSAANDYTRHVAVIANGSLYYAHSDMGWDSGTNFTSWSLAGSASPASAPDCVVTSDNTVHIVMLTTIGTVAHVYRTGTSGAWATRDLGAY